MMTWPDQGGRKHQICLTMDTKLAKYRTQLDGTARLSKLSYSLSLLCPILDGRQLLRMGIFTGEFSFRPGDLSIIADFALGFDHLEHFVPEQALQILGLGRGDDRKSAAACKTAVGGDVVQVKKFQC